MKSAPRTVALTQCGPPALAGRRRGAAPRDGDRAGVAAFTRRRVGRGDRHHGLIIGDRHGRDARRADGVAAARDGDLHGLIPLARHIIQHDHGHDDAGLACGKIHGVRDGRIVRAVRRRACDGQIHRQRIRGRAGARDRETAIIRGLRRARIGRGDRHRHRVVIVDRVSVRRVRAERRADRVREREDDRLVRLQRRVVDDRVRDDLHRFPDGESERASSERVIGPARRRAARHRKIHRHRRALRRT